jgi:hypothetical protein
VDRSGPTSHNRPEFGDRTRPDCEGVDSRVSAADYLIRELLADEDDEHLAYAQLAAHVDRIHRGEDRSNQEDWGIAAFCEDRLLPAEQRKSVEDHLSGCSSCSADVTNLSRVAAELALRRRVDAVRAQHDVQDIPVPWWAIARSWLAFPLNLAGLLRAPRWQPGYAWSLAGGATAAAAVLALTILLYREGTVGNRTVGETESSSARAGAGTATDANAAVATPTPNIVSPPSGITSTTHPPDVTLPTADPVEPIRQRTRTLLSLGNEAQALNAITEGLAVSPLDRELLKEFDDLLATAAGHAETARNQAVASKAPELARADFDRAFQLMRRAERLRRTSTADAIRAYWAAADLFVSAGTFASAAQPVQPPRIDAPRTSSRGATRSAQGSEQPRPVPTAPPVASNPTQPPPPVPGTRREAGSPAPPRLTPPPERHATPDEQAIERVLAKFENGYNSLDAQAVAQVAQWIDAGALARTFAQYASYNVSLAGTQIVVQGDTATATCVRQIQAVTKVGNVTNRVNVPTTFTLRRTDGGWRIESVR